LDGLSFDSIYEIEAIWLERDFEEGEVLEVVKAMNGNKASGHYAFYKLFAYLSKEKLMVLEKIIFLMNRSNFIENRAKFLYTKSIQKNRIP
jgi:hypothetical protein